MGLPSVADWGAGWPKDNSSKMVSVHGGGVSMSVHGEIAPIVKFLLDATRASGYVLDKTQCGGFSNRKMRGSKNTPSVHSWGLAVDLNWRNNPLQKPGGRNWVMKTDIPSSVVELWGRFGFQWGGSWRTVKDPMHFEFIHSREQAAKFVKSIRELTIHGEIVPSQDPIAEFKLYSCDGKVFLHTHGMNMFDIGLPSSELVGQWTFLIALSGGDKTIKDGSTFVRMVKATSEGRVL